MPVCAQTIEQPDGSLVLALDPAATDFTACTYVVESGAEVANSFFAMSAEDGFVFYGGVIACWLAAFAIRSIINVLKGSSE